jgi:hypothetical protein
MLGQIIEERGLAHARLTAEHDDSALTGANVGQELVKRNALRLPPQESNGKYLLDGGSATAQPYTCFAQ